VFSPDGRTFASASAQVILLWEVVTGQERWRSPELDSSVSSLAFSPDGNRLATGLYNATVLIWDVTPARTK
jgi:WD40 repeat protein